MGEQMAQARGAEQARVSDSKVGPSPLADDLHYDQPVLEYGSSNAVSCRAARRSQPEAWHPTTRQAMSCEVMRGVVTINCFPFKSRQ